MKNMFNSMKKTLHRLKNKEFWKLKIENIVRRMGLQDLSGIADIKSASSVSLLKTTSRDIRCDCQPFIKSMFLYCAYMAISK
jgi:hypothetical protein